MDNSELGFFLYGFFVGIFIYLCYKLIIESNDKNNKRNR